MVRPFDVSKFRSGLTKSIQGISTGFESDPDTWISTGNYTLNYLISGDFSDARMLFVFMSLISIKGLNYVNNL